ncbi:MAG: glycosyl hydrolase, partial [Lentisphaerota bacterium]
MLAFKEGGFGGAYLHSRTGLLTEYLGSDWWNAIDAGVEAAKAYDLEAWFYDEDKWPSGYAGGKVPMQNEAYHASCLLRLSKDVPVPPTAELLREDTAWKYVCYRAPMGNAWFNGTCWVDLFNPEMVKAFIDCSYTPYANRYSRQAGGVVKGIFTDEPQVSPSFAAVVKHAGAVSYSPVLRNWFKRENGYDILDNLLSLFEDTGDYCRIRWDYYRAVARCLEDAFSRQIGQFCANSNLVWTGHYNGENGFVGVASNVGDMMIHYRHMKRPGIDWLGLSIAHGLFPAKSLSSVANQYGLERRLSEMFGCSGQNMNFEDRKWIADWHAVLGINHVCPHLSLYSMKGCRKRDYPPTLSPQQPWWPYNKHIEDHMARMSYATTVGNFAADILVLHPMESAWLNAPLDCPANHDLDSIFSGLLNLLMGEHRDFDLGDEQILAEIGKVRPGFLDVGRMSYPIVVLPHMQTIRSSTVRLLVELRKSGGIIFSVN